ncbi:glycosyltransferase [Candidatus Acidulodesulfobacterium sp. H_13]|uniref:CgeB family protein n=1 Tax=Candidatus Acidulodesulfobacterium sp. H_13 TaxID=3395470 RepID=UPI003AF5381C
MDFFKTNLEKIKRKNINLYNLLISGNNLDLEFNLAVIKTKKEGLNSLRINNITIHSVYDPESEAIKWVKANLNVSGHKSGRIIIFGLGAGYHVKKIIKELLQKTGKKGRMPVIDVIEPALETLLFLLKNFDFSDILDYINIIIYDHGEDIESEKSLNLSEYNLLLFSLPSYQKIFGDIYSLIFKKYTIGQLFNVSKFKISVVQPVYGGSSTIGNYIHKAFLNEGYNADIIDFSHFYQAYKSFENYTANSTDLEALRQSFFNVLGETLMVKIRENPPDLVLFMAQAPVNQAVLLKIREMGIKTAYWFVEDFRLITYWDKIAPFVDYFFTIQKDDFLERLKGLGINNYYYMELACLPDFHRKLNAYEINKKDMDFYGSNVSFAGAGYYNRRNMFLKLTNIQGFKIWGRDWDTNSPLGLFIKNNNNGFTEEEAVKIYNYAKININLHSSSYHWDINPEGDFLNPRFYEIMGCGGFQLVDYRKYMEPEFEPGEDFAVFKDIIDLKRKIAYYLEHEDERDEIARHGYEKVGKYHTYERRVRDIMNIVLINSFDSFKSKFISRRVGIDKLLDEIKENEELYNIIKSMIDKGLIKGGKVSVDELAEYVKSGGGRLSKAEAILLLIQQIRQKITIF